MKTITLVRTLEGKPAIYWPGALLLFTMLLVLWVVLQSILDSAWTFVSNDGDRQSLLHIVGSGVFWTDVMLIWLVRTAWLREKALLTGKPPSARSPFAPR